MPSVQNINLPKIIKRLELIKSLISLEKEDEIDGHVFKLEQLEVRVQKFSGGSVKSDEKGFIKLKLVRDYKG